jgi:excisionase family DNA binding protein
MLTLGQLCEWLNITQRHARKLVERDAIPYRKVGHLLRFPEAEIEDWCRPARRSQRRDAGRRAEPTARESLASRRSSNRSPLPKSLIE